MADEKAAGVACWLAGLDVGSMVGRSLDSDVDCVLGWCSFKDIRDVI